MASRHLLPESNREELRIVLLGKTGVGKSSTGNTILGSDGFRTELSPASVTGTCKKETREFGEQTVAVVDTPGLFHTSKSHKEVMKEILEFTVWIRPGPHVLLLVLRLGDFIKQDKGMLEAFQNVFTDAKRHTVVLFTCGDKYDRGVDAFIESHESLKKFLDESCEAYFVFNNKAKDKCPVTDLLTKMTEMVGENEHRCYSNELFERAATAFEEVKAWPDVKSARGPEGAAIVNKLEELINQGLEELEKVAPFVPGIVMSFLKKVTDVACKCVPRR